MATPIKEDIAANLLTTINGVTVGNGFQQTIEGIRAKRVDFSNITPENNTFIMTQGEEEEDEDSANGKKTWFQHYIITCFVINSETDDTTIETPINKVEADIRKAVRVSPKRGPITGVIDTLNNASIPFPEGVDFSGIQLDISVHYRHSENDPYTA